MEGKKFDAGKTRYDLVPPEALEGIAKVFTLGAEKYGAHDWELGLAHTRIYAAILRHLQEWMQGRGIDPETGLPHLDHAGCGIMMLITLTKRRPDLDDRFLLSSLKGEAQGATQIPLDLVPLKRGTFPYVGGVSPDIFDEADAGMGAD